MNLIKHLYWIPYIVFILSCAKQSAPTGGPMDTIPPRLIASNPKHQQLNFKDKTIELEFSEYVSLNNAKEQLIITPSIGKEYEIIAKKQKVILTYDTDLRDSTTYTFNFREAVQDITERNPATNLKLAVSTGNYIDSLSVHGTVLNHKDERPLKDITVAVEPLNDTFSIFKHPATYFTKTDEKGAYQLENLKPGLYNIYAIGDQNKNLIADSKSEAYGFRKDSLLLDHNIEQLKLTVLKLDTRPLKIISARPYNTYFNVRTTKNLKSFKIKSADSTDLFYTFGPDRSNILLYNNIGTRDSVKIHLTATDSINNKIDTSFYARFNKEKLTPEKFEVQPGIPTLLADKGFLELLFTFTKPLKEIRFDSLLFVIDSLHTIHFSPADIQYDELTRLLTIQRKLDPAWFNRPESTTPPPNPTTRTLQAGKSDESKQQQPKTQAKNKLTIAKGTFISVEQDSSKAMSQQLTPSYIEDLGLIAVETTGASKSIIIELTDTKQNLISRAVHKPTATFDNLLPQEYQLRIIIDKNGNGEWDPGNYLKRQEPEQIIYWKDEKGKKDIKLKANFELGPLLISY